MTRRHIGRTAAALAGLLAVGGCSLPSDAEPEVIAAEDVPFGLLGEPSSAPEAEPGPGTTDATLYFITVDAEQRVTLQPVRRTLETTGDRAVITSLLAGRADNDPLAITNSIPAEVRLLDQPVREADDTRLVLNLSAELGIPVGDGQTQAAAQLTFTALDLPGVESVRLLIEGQPFNVGTVNDGRRDIVDAADFPVLAAALDDDD